MNEGNGDNLYMRMRCRCRERTDEKPERKEFTQKIREYYDLLRRRLLPSEPCVRVSWKGEAERVVKGRKRSR
jgi:hypothetical protein